MSMIAEFLNTPDIVITDGKSMEEETEEWMQVYGEKYREITGEDISLSQADPLRLVLLTASYFYHQQKEIIEYAGKMNFLKYAEGSALDNLALFKQLKRKEKEAARTMIRFTMTGARESATGIPAGVRVRTEDKRYFMTMTYAEIPVGRTSVDVPAEAMEAGTGSNGIALGEINMIVDPTPYILSARNVTVPSGGSDQETDSEFTYRIYKAPAGFSTAGPYGAYEYFTKASRADVGDVYIYSPEPGKVSVSFMMEDGSIPTTAIIADVKDYLSDETRRPLTDNLIVQAPEEVEYEITMIYTIDRKNAGSAETIQSAVNAAVEAYQKWQRKIGRDIIPSKLIQLVMAAGARRAEVTAPGYTVVADGKLPKCQSVSLTYGGLEDE